MNMRDGAAKARRSRGPSQLGGGSAAQSARSTERGSARAD